VLSNCCCNSSSSSSSGHRRLPQGAALATKFAVTAERLPLQQLRKLKTTGGSRRSSSSPSHLRSSRAAGKSKCSTLNGCLAVDPAALPASQQAPAHQPHCSAISSSILTSLPLHLRLRCRHKPRPPQFEGDLSEWGRTALDFHDEDDQSVASSHPTMSSGISPRDARPRVKPFDLEAAREVCVSMH
jgi:hypothetical protein